MLLELLEEREAQPRPHFWGDFAKAAGIAAAAAVLAIVGLKSVSLNDAAVSAVSDEAVDHFVARISGEENAAWVELEGEDCR